MIYYRCHIDESEVGDINQDDIVPICTSPKT